LEKNDYEGYERIVIDGFSMKDKGPGGPFTIALESSGLSFADLLKKCMPKVKKKCEVCGAKFRYFSDGFFWYPSPFCHACVKKKYDEKLKSEIQSILYDHVRIGKRYLSANINNFHKKYKNLLLFEDKEGLFIYGPRGTGKTHFMAALAREHIIHMDPVISRDGESRFNIALAPLFISVPSLLAYIRNTFRKDSKKTEIELIDYFSSKDFLLLDDLGTEKPTEWVLQTLYQIIDTRYSERKSTIISSNYTLDEIADRLDDRISSRIAVLKRLNIKSGKDRRI